MTRFRRPTLKDGELKIYWGKMPHESPDIVYSWQGDSTMSNDSRLLHYYIAAKHPDPHVSPIFSVMKPSLLEELDSRGYDLTTLKFSIKKKVTL